MGKKGGKNKPVKRTKASTLTKKVVFGKVNTSAGSAGATAKKGKTLKQQRRAGNEFEQRINELKERSIGSSNRPKPKEVPSLALKPATFQLPSQLPPKPQTYTADELLQGEQPPEFKKPTAKRAATLALSNRFGDLENDEILEDGTHSILKMDVKPATFTLPSR